MRYDIARARMKWTLAVLAALVVTFPFAGSQTRAWSQDSGERTSDASVEPRTLQSIDYQFVTLGADGREVARRQATCRVFIEKLGGGVTLEMVEIPSGVFLMGAGDDEVRMGVAAFKHLGRSPSRSLRRMSHETPRHPVAVDAFFMARYEITQAQWRAVAAMPRVERDLEPDPSEFPGDTRPVESVSWLDAVEFSARLARATGRVYALPTEAEWEYACRANTSTPFHFGSTISSTFANVWADSVLGVGNSVECREETVPVGSFGVANAFGLADMHGNVAEWCFDPWHPNYVGAPNNGSVWNTGASLKHRVTRGGSWYDHSVNCRSASRIKRDDHETDDDTGFRVVVHGLP